VIGRQDELLALRLFLDEVRGGARAVLLEGEAGIGKTTVWQRGVKLALERGYRVLQSRPAVTYDDASRLLTDGTATYQYDRERNLVSRRITATGATTQYTWTVEHELVGITHPDHSATVFRYDPLGRRVEVEHRASTRRYAYAGQAIAAECDGANTLVASYVHDPKSPSRTFEMARGGERYFYLTDALGSTRALTTSAGTTANSYTYSAFGAARQTGTVANPFTFTAQVFIRPRACSSSPCGLTTRCSGAS
jgi:YD repeat-containing protein